MRTGKTSVIIGLLVAGELVMAQPAQVSAQASGRYYPQTGHTLSSEFVQFFDMNGGEDIFGFPITDGFIDPESGLLVQYTENARLEWLTASGEQPARVVLQPLGRMVGGVQPPLATGGSGDPACQYFERTGHESCHAFLAFFRDGGGQDLFGAPISEFQIENGRVVQYFERFRLDWFPEAAAGHDIRVAPLGRVHFEQAGYDAELLAAVGQVEGTASPITSLRPSASLGNPVVSPGEAQDIYLVVRNQDLAPVEGAAALLIAHFPDRDRTFLMPITNDQGLSRSTLKIDDLPRGTTVTLEIWAIYRDLEASSRDAFTIW